MIITVKQSGGYPGGERSATVDTAKTAPALAGRLEHLVRQSGYFQQAESVNPDAVGADLFRHEIVVRDGSRSHRVTFADDGAEALAPLRELVRAVLSGG